MANLETSISMVSPLEGFTRQLKTELSACLSVNQWYWEIIKVQKIPKNSVC